MCNLRTQYKIMKKACQQETTILHLIDKGCFQEESEESAERIPSQCTASLAFCTVPSTISALRLSASLLMN